MRHLSLIMLTGVCGLCCALPAQRVWKVSCGDPNAHFVDLPQAVARAAPGDTILVYDNPSQPIGCSYTAPTIDKPLTIVGLYPGLSPGAPRPSGAVIAGLVRVRGIPAGQRVVISNMGLGPVFPPTLPHGLHAQDCAGDIVLEDFLYWPGTLRNCRFRFERCHNVVLRGCDLRLGGEPLTVIDSNVLLTTTVVRAYANEPPNGIFAPYAFTTSREALLLRNSTVTMTGSEAYGARASWNGPTYIPARVGAVIESGTLRLGPFAGILGGDDLVNGTAYSFVLTNPAAAQIIVDPRAGQLAYPGPPPVQTCYLHATYHDWLVAGEPYRVATVGPPNGFALLAVSSATPGANWTGAGLALDSPSQFIGFAPLAPASGLHQWTFVCPPMVPTGPLFCFQAAVLDPQGAISLTIPSPFTVGWRHGRIP